MSDSADSADDGQKGDDRGEEEPELLDCLRLLVGLLEDVGPGGSGSAVVEGREVG